MSLRSHNKLTAWLGLIAMWLGLVMPIVSYGMQGHDEPALNLSYCYADGHQGVQGAEVDRGVQDSHSTLNLKACGYCGLLAQHMPLPQVPHLPVAASGRYLPSAATTFRVAYPPVAYAPAHPRAPPVLFS